MLHCATLAVPTVAAAREVALVRFDVLESDGTVTPGPVVLEVDGESDAPMTPAEALAYADALRESVTALAA